MRGVRFPCVYCTRNKHYLCLTVSKQCTCRLCKELWRALSQALQQQYDTPHELCSHCFAGTHEQCYATNDQCHCLWCRFLLLLVLLTAVRPRGK